MNSGKLNKIIISRTDNLGDVVLTLPMAGLLKRKFPGCHIYFMGKSYTEPVIRLSKFISEFLDWDEIKEQEERFKQIEADAIIHVYPERQIARLSKESKIPLRIGTISRFFHWYTCNRLVNLKRKKSNIHEAQLNLKLLKPLDINKTISLEKIPDLYGWPMPSRSTEEFASDLLPDRFNLIVHMKSFGNAKEWSAPNYSDLINQLPPDKFNIIISGTQEEGKMIRQEVSDIFQRPNIRNIAGKYNLEAFIRFIQHADGLLACSTGPLHLAAAAGIHALGLYPVARPKHAARWAPLGKKAETISESTPQGQFLNISVESVRERILNWI
jgi:ADP-heptose:LPS heptosyltransferase